MNAEKLFSKQQLNGYLKGTNHRAFDIFGAHFCQLDGVDGCRFAVWAPRAAAVYLVGDFNNWNEKETPMYSLWDTGVFCVFVPGVKEYAHYKYLIFTQDGRRLEKADPYAFYAQQPMDNASRVVSLDYQWQDEQYLCQRNKEKLFSQPFNIYEVHLGSWRRNEEGEVLTYSELAPLLVDYVKEMGYTHIEIMPITEYPLEDSWGYQVTGYFAPTSKYGTPQDFMYFVDYCHQQGIGVLLDWVPAHFPKDDFALAEFDGYPLYEYGDSRVGEHKQWGTLVFDYGKPAVVNFLLSSGIFWAETYHIDGFRVDAVSSMIYLDYMRIDYLRNRYGGNENLEALDFLRCLNQTMNREFPQVVMIAEESTNWRGITHPVEQGGLGFDYKWNMGWMNDILRYMQREPMYRKYHHQELTFSMVYAFDERFILPFSHDEVVHSELSLVDKMPGDYWQKFANLRLLYGYMYTHPGKKLTFMGNEFAQFIEWKYYDELEWFLLDYPSHKGMQTYSQELNHFYQEHPPLWENEGGWEGFRWINPDNAQESVLSYLRYGKNQKDHLVVICNFTPKSWEDYRLGLPHTGNYKEVFNSDWKKHGGSGVENSGIFGVQPIPWDEEEQSFAFRLPPLGCVIFAPTQEKATVIHKKKEDKHEPQ